MEFTKEGTNKVLMAVTEAPHKLLFRGALSYTSESFTGITLEVGELAADPFLRPEVVAAYIGGFKYAHAVEDKVLHLTVGVDVSIPAKDDDECCLDTILDNVENLSDVTTTLSIYGDVSYDSSLITPDVIQGICDLGSKTVLRMLDTLTLDMMEADLDRYGLIQSMNRIRMGSNILRLATLFPRAFDAYKAEDLIKASVVYEEV